MRAFPFILVVLILGFGVVTAVQNFNALPGDPTPTAVRPTVTPRPRPTSPRPAETVQPLPALPASPTATPRPEGAPSVLPPGASGTSVGLSVMKVGNTDRMGVYIRHTPNMNDKIRPWTDGTPMVVLGKPETINGISWTKVRAPDSTEGYVPSQYLVP